MNGEHEDGDRDVRTGDDAGRMVKQFHVGIVSNGARMEGICILYSVCVLEFDGALGGLGASQGVL